MGTNTTTSVLSSLLDPYDDVPHFSVEDLRILLLLISLCYLMSTGNRRRSLTTKSPFTARAFAFLDRYGTFGLSSSTQKQQQETTSSSSSVDTSLLRKAQIMYNSA